MMIRINLLPDEYRRSERTSPKVFAAMLGSVVAVCSVFGWLGMIYFGELSELQDQNTMVTETLARKQQRATYFDQLDGQRKDYTTRVQTIQNIGRSRMLWTKFLDEFLDVIDNNNDLERHLAWFDKVTIKDAARKKGPIVTMPGAVQGGEINKVANLHKDIMAADLFRDIASKSPPSGKVQEDKVKTPPKSYRFEL